MSYYHAGKVYVLEDIVFDTNFCIDLDKGGILGDILFLRDTYRFVSSVFIKDEIKSIDTSMLEMHIMAFVDLPGSDVRLVSEYVSRYRGISYQDGSTLALAKRMGCLLITRDGLLQEAAEHEGVSTEHSVWVIERMIEKEVLKPKEAISAIQSIISKRPRFKDGIGLDRLNRLLRVK